MPLQVLLLFACLLLLCANAVRAGHLHRHIQYRRTAEAVTPRAESPAGSVSSAELSVELKNLQDGISFVQGYLDTLEAQVKVIEQQLSMPTTPATIVRSSRPVTSSALRQTHLTTKPKSSSKSLLATSATSKPRPTASTLPKQTFDPASRTNLAVYYGQTANTTAEDLLGLCSDPRVNIVNMAFVSTFFGPNNYPTAWFGSACNFGQTAAQARLAPGLSNCTALGPIIKQCQQVHQTKVLVSLGGYIASSSFSSASQAESFATTVWNLFGGGRDLDPGLRPFGPDVTLDGVDLDNEDHNQAYWPAFTSALRRLFARDPTKRYYISAAPQCPRPDASIPPAALAAADWVWVQFYNNPPCQLASGPAFASSVAAWSAQLASYAQNGSAGPRLYIGLPAWSGAGSGYVAPEGLEPALRAANLAAVENLGGVMLWDGPVAERAGYVGAVADAMKSVFGGQP